MQNSEDNLPPYSYKKKKKREKQGGDKETGQERVCEFYRIIHSSKMFHAFLMESFYMYTPLLLVHVTWLTMQFSYLIYHF